MKLAKYLTILVTLLLATYGAGWYYIMNEVAGQINHDYAGKKHPIKAMRGDDYNASFEKVLPVGFPLKFQLKVMGWKEESASAEITYNSPIYAGYDLGTQKIKISYDGEIIAAFKPAKNNFGSKFLVDNYFITIDMPITKELIETFKTMKDSFEIVNHMGKIKVGTGRVRIYDRTNDKLFHEKEYEQLNFTFTARKYYTSYEDFMANLPDKYAADYVAKTKPNSEPARLLPVSLFYGFSTLPNDFYVIGKADIITKGKTIETIANDLDAKVNFKFESPMMNMDALKFEYRSLIDKNIPSFNVHTDAKFKLKEGAFDELFRRYGVAREFILKNPAGETIDREIQYIIKNKEAFKFKELENVNYKANLQAQGSDSKARRHVKIDNFSLFSESSGFKVNAESNIENANLARGIDRRWKAQGVLFIQNYPAIVDFSSAYIYRFGKFRYLNDEARKLYIDVNKKFLKKISDHPNSTSNDLTYEFAIDSSHYDKTKFGSIRFEQIGDMYSAELFSSLIDKVGTEGDFVKRMKDIVPDLDLNSPIIKRALPKLQNLQNLDKGLGNDLPKELQKSLPKEAQELIKNVVPGGVDKKIDKKLWNNLLK